MVVYNPIESLKKAGYFLGLAGYTGSLVSMRNWDQTLDVGNRGIAAIYRPLVQHRPWLFFYFMAVPGFFVMSKIELRKKRCEWVNGRL